MLTVIAGAVITTAGVVFFLLVVSLQLASGQFSPRVLRGFWRDRRAQILIGLLLLEEAKVTEQVLTVLRRRVRTAHGRAEEPSAGIIESQSVKGADTVPRTSRGYDATRRSTAASGSLSPTPSACSWSCA